MSDESLQGEVVDDVAVSEPVEDIKKDTAQDDTNDQVVESDSDDDVVDENTDENSGQGEDKPKRELTDAEKKAHALEKRVARQTAAYHESQREVNELREQLAKLTPKEEDTAPKEEDFETFEEYDNARIEYEADKRLQAKEREAKQKQLIEKQQKQYAERKAQFEERETKFRQETPDYVEKAEVFQEVADQAVRKYGENNPVLQAIGEIVIESDFSPHLIHHIGSNPDLIDDLAGMSRVAAVRELFKLENTFSQKPKPEHNPKPKPVKSLKGSGKPGSKPLVERSGKELLKWADS